MLQACAQSHNGHFLQPMSFRLPCCLFSLYQIWQRKLTLFSKIKTCFLWYFGMHNLWHKFRLSSLQTSHRISLLLQLWHTISLAFLIYFLIMFPFSRMFWKFIFLSWIPSSRFLFILAFPFLLQPRKDACQPLLDIFQMLWQMVLSVFYLCVEVCQATQGIPSHIECRQMS
jgi:hypothetical protein